MSNERPDEFLSWRGRLTPPDALPEQGLDDKEVSWERLAERLRGRPRRNRIGYWIAAACFILALVPASTLFRNRPVRLSVRPPAQRPLPVSPGTASRPAAPQTTTRQTPAPQTAALRPTVPQVARLRPTPTMAPHSTALTPPYPTPIPSNPTPAANSTLTANQTPVADSTPAANPTLAANPDPATNPSPPVLGPPAPPKHPLRIAYLNEINKNATTPGMLNRKPPFFRFGPSGNVEWALKNNNNTPALNINLSSSNH